MPAMLRKKEKKIAPATLPLKRVVRKRKFEPPQLLKGMKDILPEEQQYRLAILQKLEAIAVAYGYQRIDTPVVEQASLFTRSIGEVTDIVEKEMYVFEDKSGDRVSLRPEFTAGICRAYIEHGMINRTQPVKLYTMGPLFRHDRPQAGRYRQFHQLDFEVLGEGQPVIDAELIAIGYFLLRDLSLDATVQINSVGDAQCRPQYIQQLQDYYRPKKKNLCENCKLRFSKNPLRLLDCKEPVCQEISQDAPQIVDHLCVPCRDHFVKVLEHLDETQVPYTLNSKIVRGLDYYTRTTWEFFPVVDSEEQLRSQSALIGGGRYDGLLEQLGSTQPTPASGFAAGIERIVLELKAKNITLPGLYIADVFLAQLGESAQKRSLALLEQLRQAGFRVWANLVKESLTSQLKIADKVGARFTLILGQKELIDGTIIIRDMDSGSQEIIDIKKLEKELSKRLSKSSHAQPPKQIGPYDEVELNPNAVLPAEPPPVTPAVSV
ncbi:MAG: histidine--tRNA ligase [Candidatus Kerfeldbacteria bacterium]|nr:histidine--tRNA ligase [Candidatus Kerfeldbacteria bacterium]